MAYVPGFQVGQVMVDGETATLRREASAHILVQNSVPAASFASKRRRSSAPHCLALCLGMVVMATGCFGSGSSSKRADQPLPDMSNPDKAAPALENRIKKDPEDEDALKALGQLYVEQGKYKEAEPILRKATRLDSRDAKSLFALGEALTHLDQQQEAAAAYHAALNNDRTNDTYHKRLRATLEGLGYYEQYVAAVKEILVRGPEQANMLVDLGNEYMKQAHYRAAADAYKGALATDPGLTGMNGKYGQALVAVRAYEEAVEALEEAIKEEPGNAEYQRLRGDALRKLERHKEAVIAYEKGLKLNKTDSAAIAGMALSYHALGRDTEAMRLLDQATRRDKNNLTLLLAYGRVQLDKGQWPSAAKTIDAAVKAGPNAAESHLLKGTLLLKQSQFEAAEKELNVARQADPDNAEVHLRLAEVYNLTRREGESEASVRTALKLNKNLLAAHELLAGINERAGRYEPALGSYDKLARKNKDNAYFKYKLGEMHLLLGEIKDARDIAEGFLANKKWARDANGPLLMGRVLLAEGDLKGALTQLTKAASLNPKSSEVQRAVGDVARQGGDLKKAEAAYRASVRLQGDNRAAHLALGETLWLLGREPEGKIELETVIKLSGESIEAKKARELLQNGVSAKGAGPK